LVLRAIPKTGGPISELLITVGVLTATSQISLAMGRSAFAYKAISVASDAATLAQTVAEVLASPAIFTNTLSLQMKTRVIVSSDPDKLTFPDRARHYEVRLTYDKASKVVHKITGTVAIGQAEPIDVTFDAVPSGGTVSVEVILTAADDTIVGGSTGEDGELGPYGPIKNDTANAGEISLAIKERLIPLTAATQYEHQRKLVYRSGARVWEAGPAPTATRGDLCQGLDDRLCNLGGITIHQRTGNLGYAFQAGGQGVPLCGQSGDGGLMYMIQNISLANGRDRALKQLECGFSDPAAVAYDRLGPRDGPGRNFFVQPTSDGFFLQSIAFDNSQRFDLNAATSWGRFSQEMDALAVHPMGYVVGVNRANHKMEIIQLPDTALSGDAIPFAVQKAGEGKRAGLLGDPVALTVFEGAILVLEAGNQRVQAFDVSGNPVNLFKDINGDNRIPTFRLKDVATYLDIGVDGLGYVYVLSFVDAGDKPSHYRLDIYDPDGAYLTRTGGVAAGRMAVDTFRAVYALNFETLAGAPRVEPSLSHWVPNTPQ
jgi:hypothetical protein